MFFQANFTINEMIAESRSEKKRFDPGFDVETYKKRMGEKFPELSDPRCFSHAMRPIPFEHSFALHNSKFKSCYLVDIL